MNFKGMPVQSVLGVFFFQYNIDPLYQIKYGIDKS